MQNTGRSYYVMSCVTQVERSLLISAGFNLSCFPQMYVHSAIDKSRVDVKLKNDINILLLIGAVL